MDPTDTTGDPDFPQAWQGDIGLFVTPEAAAFIAPASQAPSSEQGALLPLTPPGQPFPTPGQGAWAYAFQAGGAVENLGFDPALAALYMQQLPDASETAAFWSLYDNFANGSLSTDGRSVAVEVTAKDGDTASMLQELQAIGLQDGGDTASGARGWLPIDQLGALLGLPDFGQAHRVLLTNGPLDSSNYPWQLLSDDAEQVIYQTAASELPGGLTALYLEQSPYAAETEPFWSTALQVNPVTNFNYISADGTEVAIIAYARDGNDATLQQQLQSIGLQDGYGVPGGGVWGELPIDEVGALLGLSDFGGARESQKPVTPTYADGSPIRPSGVVLWDTSQPLAIFTYLYGAPGGDPVLTGGAGNNTFVFASGWGHDTIMGWTSGVSSTIDLTALASAGIHGLSDLTQAIVDGSDTITSGHTGSNSITVNGVGAPLTGSSFRFA